MLNAHTMNRIQCLDQFKTMVKQIANVNNEIEMESRMKCVDGSSLLLIGCTSNNMKLNYHNQIRSR